MLMLLIEHDSFRIAIDAPHHDQVQSFRLDDVLQTSKKSSADIVINESLTSALGFMSCTPDRDTPKEVSLDSLIDGVFQACGKENTPHQSLTFQDFLKWHLNSDRDNLNKLVSCKRLGRFLLDLRLLGSIIFGIKPSTPDMERVLVAEVMRRSKSRYLSSDEAKAGPSGTIWYV